jgi:hypothetical protein
METGDDLKGFMEDWLDYFTFSLPYTFFEDVIQMRDSMRQKEVIDQIPMLEYKKLLLEVINTKYGVELSFNDAELIHNRTATNMKVTKNIKRELDLKNNFRYGSFPEIDYFHKLKYEDNEYFITSNPFDIVEGYREIQTCLSAGGENQSNLFELLASPYYYMLTDLRTSIRMNLFINHESKNVFISQIYGSYDYMAVFSVINHFILSGYKFSNSFNDFGQDEISYVDRFESPFIREIDIMNGNYVHQDDRVGVMSLFEVPKTIDFKVTRDFFTGINTIENRTVEEALWTQNQFVTFNSKRFCYECQGVVDADEFDDDSSMCYYCAESHCHGCGQTIYYDELGHDMGVCPSCFEDFYPERYEEYIAEQKAEEKFEEERI